MKYFLVLLSFSLFGCSELNKLLTIKPTNGIGKWEYKNTSVYESEWKDSKKHGKWKSFNHEDYYNMNIPSYDGKWKDDKQNSQGKSPLIKRGFSTTLLRHYVGEWKDGK